MPPILEGMHWIVDNCDLVVAVWDGSASIGSGGTGAAIDRAILMNRAWIHLDVSELSVIYHLSTDAKGRRMGWSLQRLG